MSKMTKKQKLGYVAFLGTWAIIAVGIYFAAVNSKNPLMLLAVTYAYIAIVTVCAVIYAVIYCRIISLRKKAGVAPEEAFDFEICKSLTQKEKNFLQKSNGHIKTLMVLAVPVMFIIALDVVITMLM